MWPRASSRHLRMSFEMLCRFVPVMSETSTLKNSHGTWCIVTLKFTRSTSSRNSSTTSVVADLSAKYSESSKRKSVIITMVPMSEMIMPGVLLMTRSSGTCLK